MNGGDAGDGTVLSLGVGFAIALVVIVGAFFQDAVVAVVRWLLGGAAAGGRAAGRGAAFVVHRVGRAVHSVGRAGTAGAPTAAPRRPGARSRPDSMEEAERREGSASLDELTPEGASTVARDPAQQPGAPQSELPRNDLPNGEPPPSEPPARRERVRSRSYSPASSIGVEASVRSFVEQRGGRTSIDALVRHLDREFGSGLGVTLLGTLEKRGLIEIRREPGARTQLVVALLPTQIEARDE